MAGTAKTDEFLLSTATVMIGPQDKVMELNPDDHSIGLVKNVAASADMSFTELTQGLSNQVVASINTKTDSKISFEVYEYTARNLAYGAGLDGSSYAADPVKTTLSADLAGGGAAVALTDTAGIVAGDHIVIQDGIKTDYVHVGKVGSVDAGTKTVTLAAGYEVPATANFAAATTTVYKVNAIGIGTNAKQPTFGAKLVGLLPNSNEPVTLIFPKVKITKGLSVAFQTDNFSNMGFEFTPYQLVANDPFYADFLEKTWKVLKA